MNEATTIENQRLLDLESSRAENKQEKIDKKQSKLAVWKNIWNKVSENWLILMFALFFDVLGLIPFIGVVFNFIFVGILYLKFGGKGFGKTAITVAGGSIIDFFVGILPVNVTATLVRILMK
ncbi:hypothetical protein ACFLZC_01390 [Patescibacteria group bacterium]